MKMKVLMVDNHPGDPVLANMQAWIDAHFPGSQCHIISQAQFDPADIFAYKPDVAIVDVALDQDEESHFDDLLADLATFVPGKVLSGIEYCRRLKASFSDLPVLLMSKYFDPRILTTAIEAGADGFLYKMQLEEQHFVPALEATFVRCKTDDIAFYAKLRALLEDTNAPAWKRERMMYAMDAFFTHGSGTRRLTGLWCALAELVEEVLPSDTVNELLRMLMDTEALLLAANPRMRDHVRHAGNVFWLGYYLLNSIDAFRDTGGIPQLVAAAFSGSSVSVREQTNLAWLLAALLHDIGYLRERMQRIEDRIERGRLVFGCAQRKKVTVTDLTAPTGLDALQPYLETLGAEGSRLYSAIAHTLSLWGRPQPKDDKKSITDHGIASASALLGSLRSAGAMGSKRPEVLHAAAAIALHNLPKWNTEWCEPGGLVRLPVNVLPVGWLLAYCDELQGWGREPEADPFNVELCEKVSEARRRFKEGYVRGSRISAFAVSDSDAGMFRKTVEVDIQYMMVHGENADAAPADVREGIVKWRRDRVGALRKTLGLDTLLETTITHRIPGPVGDDIVAKLDTREGS